MSLHNTAGRLNQLQRLGPSSDTYKLLDEVCTWMDTSVTVLAADLDENQPSIRWAFTMGKSPRAQELRNIVIAELRRRLNGEGGDQEAA